MVPTIGRIVHYILTGQDAATINARRDGEHHANGASEGDVYPMLICRVWGTTPEAAVNGQVFVDGDFTFWVTSATLGEGPRHYFWPVRD